MKCLFSFISGYLLAVTCVVYLELEKEGFKYE